MAANAGPQSISIPYGSIKSSLPTWTPRFLSYFNSLWFD